MELDVLPRNKASFTTEKKACPDPGGAEGPESGGRQLSMVTLSLEANQLECFTFTLSRYSIQ